MSKGLVLIPTYNERENAELIIRKVMSLPRAFDLLIIDDGSPDGTAAIVRSLQAEFPDRLFLEERTGKQGLGTAYIHGFRWALARGYEYVFEMDADFSHNPDDLLRLYDACAVDGYDLAIGSRYIEGVNVVNWPMSRVLMSYFASWYVKLVTGMPVNDATAGFKCYTARVLRAIDLSKIHFVGYAFQIEMKWLAYKLGFRIKEVPIIFTDRTRGTSKMSSGIFQEALFGVLQMKISSWVHPVKPAATESTE
ncbi:polyprenol monophosphomannose synthase [Hymenobacter negativus]|uniref:Polyprenol monophosphomannose synthase n=1 Tax=Hymenobacter negativus TaxID=2795026 RepID=A0ABS3QAF3_9BACT|nr:polyprenol monophosphomannose synthase [Hymenobacter negativus]MBO2008232.1 polyprenol monophosphomannose synthase [Hymenobacter negativus]